ncbi:hypothetical protein NAMH_0011 [Nautilia profundicola AmH]|uniref:Uncharacterized protein n=1 Tax=Nautilia profundicola (strain ATCC BAA-1463 / DSM 18972 / AmH) TaxID=598659 RepID=B9L745_NAUPA|nr:hypothetical protein [Nautilia profundicola]ACM92649.1 hypothetical protein NAMH_0011 [Nautilia profundicola AmH]
MKVILYTKDFNEKINEPVDIILSPQFYWIKKIDIPIKSLKDAKKLSKTLFKLDDTYLYDAFEINGKYYAYAIKKNININIDKKFINSIRLAQTELYDFNIINVSKNYSIQKIDDLLFCFPNIKNAPYIKDILPSLKLSKNKINIFNRIKLKKSVVISLLLLFLFINISFLLNIIKNKQTVKNLELKKAKIIHKYHLPKTTYQIKAILNELKEKDFNQNKIKKDLEFITKTPLKNDETFISLSYDKNRFDIEINSKRNFDNYFKKKFIKVNSNINNIYKASLYE